MFFEGIGVLLYRELIDIDLTEDIFSGSIKKTWGKVKPIVEDDRKKLDDPATVDWFECLYNEMKKREQKLLAQQ